MKYLKYAFLGLFSLGFLGLIGVIALVVYVFNAYGSDLPDYEQLKVYEPPIVSRLYAGDGRLMAEFAQEKRVFMPSEEMPDIVKNAFIAAEDQNFYTHEGVDPFAIARASVVYVKHLIGKDVDIIGGSTITQQVVKNMLLTNERKFERKIREAILSTRMEKALSKDRILELYLNEIFLGARSYGVAAASLQYFDKSLDELTIAEAAYLAALPKAPNNYHPVRNQERALSRRNWVLGRMLAEGYISQEEAETAVAQPLETTSRNGEDIVNAPYFTEEVRRILAETYGQESLYGGGLAVRSTIDPALQEIAETSLRNGLKAYDRRHGWRGAIKNFESASDWKTKLSDFVKPEGILPSWKLAFVLEATPARAKIGFVDGTSAELPLKGVKWARKCIHECYGLGPLVTAVSQVVSVGDIIMVEQIEETADAENKETTKFYELQQVPDIQGALIALDPHTGRILAMQGGWEFDTSVFNRATQAQRQPGSAFKPFIYLAALESDLTPATLILDAPFTIEDRPGHYWSPSNYSGKFYGPTPLRVGVEKSKNLMTVRLAEYLGMEKIADYARRFGIMNDMPPHLANSLGAGETTLLKMTSAYGVLVNGGKKITPTLIDRIQDRHGKTIFRHDTRSCINCGDLMKWKGQDAPALPDNREQLADPRAAYQMTSIMQGVVERGTALRAKKLGRPLAGKTGTTNKSKDTWFIGFSPDLVVGVFAGFDNPRSLGKRETGSSVALPIFIDFMKDALKDEPILPFRIPSGIKNVQINAKTGARASFDDQNVIWESFTAGTEPTRDIYILDGNGINLLPSYAVNEPSAYYDAYSNTYDNNLYNSGQPADSYGYDNAGNNYLDTIDNPQNNNPNNYGYNPNNNPRTAPVGENSRYKNRPPYRPSQETRPPTPPAPADVSGTGGLY